MKKHETSNGKQIAKLIRLLEPISKYYERALSQQILEATNKAESIFDSSKRINKFIENLDEDKFAKEWFEEEEKDENPSGIDDIIASKLIRDKSGLNEATSKAIYEEIRGYNQFSNRSLGISTKNIIKLRKLGNKKSKLEAEIRDAETKRDFIRKIEIFIKKATESNKFAISAADIKVWALEEGIEVHRLINQYVTAVNNRLEPLAPPRRTRRNPITSSIRLEILKRDEYRCVLCGKTRAETSLEIDHIMPVAQGGTDEMSNLHTLCSECNRSKKHRIISI